ncbi:Heme-binding-like protein, chloroplastic [Cucurbita argyrosperma subsp. argyrosperma]|nr:Heme-binding-like protein, chloroplastic [Cucurbita argyrosperma subsp. argyrosperma]
MEIEVCAGGDCISWKFETAGGKGSAATLSSSPKPRLDLDVLILCKFVEDLLQAPLLLILRPVIRCSYFTVAIDHLRSGNSSFSCFCTRFPSIYSLSAVMSRTRSFSTCLIRTSSSGLQFCRGRLTKHRNTCCLKVPDLEDLKFKVLNRRDEYEIRKVERKQPYLETVELSSAVHINPSMPIPSTFLNKAREKIEMTRPVLTSQYKSDGEKMDMITPVVTKKMFQPAKGLLHSSTTRSDRNTIRTATPYSDFGSEELSLLICCLSYGSTYKPSKLPPAPLEIWAYEDSPSCKLVRGVLVELELPHLVLW